MIAKEIYKSIILKAHLRPNQHAIDTYTSYIMPMCCTKLQLSIAYISVKSL